MPTAPSCPTTSYHNSSGRSLKRSLSLSLCPPSSLRIYTHTPCSKTCAARDPSVRPSSPRFPPDSFPLRLVPEGNKDGSAYVQPATGGGARLPSVGRTNANDCSMQDGVGIHRAAPRHAIHHPSRRLYLACSAYTFSLSSTPLRIYLPLSLFLPLFKIPRKFRRREKGIPFSLSLSRIFPPVNRAFRIPRSIRFLLLRSRFLEKTETNPGRKTVEGESIALAWKIEILPLDPRGRIGGEKNRAGWRKSGRGRR